MCSNIEIPRRAILSLGRALHTRRKYCGENRREILSGHGRIVEKIITARVVISSDVYRV